MGKIFALESSDGKIVWSIESSMFCVNDGGGGVLMQLNIHFFFVLIQHGWV